MNSARLQTIVVYQRDPESMVRCGTNDTNSVPLLRTEYPEVCCLQTNAIKCRPWFARALFPWGPWHDGASSSKGPPAAVPCDFLSLEVMARDVDPARAIQERGPVQQEREVRGTRIGKLYSEYIQSYYLTTIPLGPRPGKMSEKGPRHERERISVGDMREKKEDHCRWLSFRARYPVVAPQNLDG